MSLTSSAMLPLGTIAPPFSLPDTVTGKRISLDDVASATGILIMFICNHCPYVQHIKNELKKLGDDYSTQGIALLAISSNDATHYPEDAPDKLASMARELGFVFPFLYDETQAVAKAYTARCTPDFFLFDKGKKLVYRGQLDGSRPGSGQPVTGKDLRKAMDALLAGGPISETQSPSLGCSIKWKI